ncbi:muellerian-inhibiting factor isoform X1 [Aquila chrysaetos chrysaetos]|uniref:muellerian-inhibiting factor isoform X1 n=1 Tax=Aquila chrysaetos chrysaetos TaxID=223781 RepID=UPI001B7D2FFE|nr:muellerian-inhibiting factor isoform X1 [Aquila chrysaetos chrysaetos]
MKAALQVLLLWLVLLLPSAALPRKGSTGERISPINRLELSLPEELGLEAEERERENASLQKRVRPSSAERSRMTAATRLFSKPDPGAKCLQGMAEDGDIGWSGSSLHPWPLGGLEGPVCRVKMDQDGLTPRHLEVVGVLTHYESSFIKLLRQRTSWDESYLETFGLCPAGEAGAALHPLKHIHAHVVEPGQDRFLVLHLEEAELASAGQLGKRLFPRQCCWLQRDGHNVPELLEELPREKRFPRGSARENLPEPLWERGSPLLAGAAGFAPLTTSLKSGICRVPPPRRLPSRTFGHRVGRVLGHEAPSSPVTPPGALWVLEGGFTPSVFSFPVKWEAQAKLRFKLVFQAEVGRWLGELRFASLLFYLGSREGLGTGRREELLATGVGLAREQSLCLARDTQYLVLGAAVASVTRSSEQLSFEASLAIRHGGEGGTPLSSTETQQLLFGSDDKCFTRMTPVVLLLAKSRQEEEVALAPFSYLSAEGVVDIAPYPQLSPPQAGTEELPSPTAPSQANASSLAPSGSSQFLSILTRFIRQVLSPSSEPPTQPSSRHWLDFQVMETLPHQLLNLSEEAALERLVQSEEPSVLLFPQDGGAVLEQHLGDWQPEGTVLQLLMGKLQTVIQELKDISAFQANMGLFQHLLSFCYYPLGPGEGQTGERPAGSGKLHTLLLLKALQTVRARWQERRKVLRQNRSARHQAHCRLQELTIDLHDRKFIVMPTVYAANNCDGPCKLPLSTRVPSYYSHTVLLLGMQERGSPLQRAPCCVPVRYSDQLIISLSTEGLEVRKFPNMVAEECGCR